MAWNEEGGVCTQKMIAATAVLVMVLAAGAVLFETSSNVDGSTTYIQGDTNLVKVGGTLTYQIMFFESDDFETLSISYSAVLKDSNGSNQSGAVSPSTGTMTNGVESTLTITAPKTAGNYTLSVTFTEVKDGGASVKTERTQSVNVVEPVVLSANLMDNSKVGFTDYVVYFKVNGNLIKESRTLVSVAANQTTTVTYEWVTDSLPTGTYKFQVVAGDENIGSSQTSFTGGEGTFYVGHADFGLIGILLAILLVVLIIVIVYIYRKPVKNYGKPKSRR
jgi:hypothetical protein